MGSDDDSDLIYMKELLDCSAAEQPARSSIGYLPSLGYVLRVGPHQVTEGPATGYLNIAFDSPNLVNGPGLGG